MNTPPAERAVARSPQDGSKPVEHPVGTHLLCETQFSLETDSITMSFVTGICLRCIMKTLADSLGPGCVNMLAPLMPYPANPGENMQAQVERMGKVRSKQQGEKCEIKLREEKQFNRKVEINSELRNLKQELESLIE